MFEVALACEAAAGFTKANAPGGLPPAAALSSQGATSGLAGATALAGVYALVVDDEPDILMGFLHGLGRSGCYVQTTRSVAETRQWLDATERLPDALIVDYRLAHGETAWDIIALVEQACGGPQCQKA